MRAVVCSYINPDLDGVACSIAVEILERPKWSACVLGALDAETSLVLHDLGFTFPPSVNGWDAVDEIWLVDTHHASQLPPDLPESRVTRITDHHPGGNPSRYANADIQNEHVGAAATLVAERFLESKVTIPVDVAMLLQAAIVSNCPIPCSIGCRRPVERLCAGRRVQFFGRIPSVLKQTMVP